MLEIIENEKESNRKKPPKHIADFDLKDRKKFAEELGLPWQSNWQTKTGMNWNNIPDDMEKQLSDY